MTILDRYLAGAVISGTLLTLGGLTPLMGIFLLSDELNTIGTARYGLGEAMLFTLLSLPRYLYQLFPIATLIGALFGLGTLASRSELVAMRAAGLSVAQLVRSALLGGVLLALLAVVLGEWIAPIAEQRGLELRRHALSGEAAQHTPHGFWAIDDGAYVNIRAIQSGTQLADIDIYRVDASAGTLEATHAKHAYYQNGRWLLTDIARSRVSKHGVQVEQIAEAEWNSLLDPDLLKVVVVDPQVLPVWGLYTYIRFMAVNQQDASAYEVAFWAKVLHPVLTLSMILIAIPLLLGSARTSGLGRRLLVGILVGLLYYLISRSFAYLALLFGLNALLASLAAPVLFISAALWWLRRVG